MKIINCLFELVCAVTGIASLVMVFFFPAVNYLFVNIGVLPNKIANGYLCLLIINVVLFLLSCLVLCLI